MATLVLAAGASALIATTGLTGTILATVISATAYLAGGMIDSYLIGRAMGSGKGTNITQEGPRIQDVQVTTATEGSYITRLYGRMRLGGTIIWATKFRERVVVTTQTQGGGGKGGGGGGQTITTTTTTYEYYQSFAVGLCEGPVLADLRVFADGQQMDLRNINYRFYNGTETQGPDPKISATEGPEFTPGYRGVAYIVFEELFLEPYGNRTPMINVELCALPMIDDPAFDTIESRIPGFDLIPGSGEFVYAINNVKTDQGSVTINNSSGRPDALESLRQLQAFAPNLQTVAVVCSWHGTDLRIGNCQLHPKVEVASGKNTSPYNWQVSGIGRDSAQVVSQDSQGRAYIGGAIADKAVYDFIRELKNRGLFVIFYPFIMMDIPPTNTLPNPYSDNAAAIGQPAFPWRGRITCSPAAGYAGTVDKTPAAATQVASFFGSATPGHFGNWDGNTIPYSGPDEWSYRRMILHYAKLCQQAGGVDAFIIGSEMVQMTTIRSDTSTYPAVAQLQSLAADVRTILGSGTKIGYAANWDEYHSHRPGDGSGDVHFHLDPLWADSNIDFVGIDWYAPLTDWRDNPGHLDSALSDSIYDLNYLKGRIEAGENYDWYYASQSDRDNQNRTPIVDTTYGEHWIFRNKDIRNWWLNEHHNRPGGVRDGSPTVWVPEGKPIWITEFGCPAIDKGTNQPNVFYDPKSSESAYPFYSSGARDDLIQHQFIRAFLEYWHPDAGHNPTSSVYGQHMITWERTCIWAWDMRPYPTYPQRSDVWADTDLYWWGHWQNGRLGQVELGDLIKHLIRQVDPNLAVDTSTLLGLVRGYMLNSNTSVREAIAPLSLAYHFDVFESDGKIKFAHRGKTPIATITKDDLVRETDGAFPVFKMTRTQESELPSESVVRYYDEAQDYSIATAYSRRLIGRSQRKAESQLPIVMDLADVQAIVDSTLIDAWVMRERLEFTLPPSRLAFDPSDVLLVDLNGRQMQFRIDQISYENKRQTRLLRTDPSIYQHVQGAASPTRSPSPKIAGTPQLRFLDVPILQYPLDGVRPYLAGFLAPWQILAVYRAPDEASYQFDTVITGPSYMGTLTDVRRRPGGESIGQLEYGPFGVWDRTHELEIEFIAHPPIETVTELTLLTSRLNVLAIQHPTTGEWELLQFRAVSFVSGTTYRLSDLVRGQLGTEFVTERTPITSGAQCVLVTPALSQTTLSLSQRASTQYYRFGPASLSIDDETYNDSSFVPMMNGLRPFSPVQLRMYRELSGSDDNRRITWRRRTRINAGPEGDDFNVEVLPLNEEFERYRVRVYNGVNVVREVFVDNAEEWVYTNAMQVADWTTPQTTYDIGVAQISNTYGPGVEKREVLDIYASTEV